MTEYNMNVSEFINLKVSQLVNDYGKDQIKDDVIRYVIMNHAPNVKFDAITSMSMDLYAEIYHTFQLKRS